MAQEECMPRRGAIVPVLLTATVAVGCRCPSVAGPTTAPVTVGGTLAPGEARIFDVSTPAGTDQVSLTIGWVPGLEVWRVDQSCTVAAIDQCSKIGGVIVPAGGSGAPPQAGTFPGGSGAGADVTRFAVRNTRTDASISFTLTMAPRRNGCG
jgi:hypothetical protein